MEPIPSPPSFELQGPDDVESIQKARKFFADGQERLADIKRDFNECGEEHQYQFNYLQYECGNIHFRKSVRC